MGSAMVSVTQAVVGTLRLDVRDESHFVGEKHHLTQFNHKVRTEVEHSKETGEIQLTAKAVASDGTIVPGWSRVQHYLVHRTPLRVENWDLDDQIMPVPKALAVRDLQDWVNLAVDRATGTGNHVNCNSF